MNKTKDRIKNRKIKIPRYKYVIAFMISIFILILPFVSRLKLGNITGKPKNIFPNKDGIYIDLFLYYKEVFIIAFGVFLILFFIGERIFPDKKLDYPLRENSNRKIVLYVSIYSITVIVSYLFSQYKELSLMGSPTEFEGIFVLITYMILFLAGINYFCYQKSIVILKRVIIIFITLIVILTGIEFFYKPLFEIDIFRNLLAGKEYSTILNSIQNKDYQGMVSLTLYNPNYFGALCTILFPITLTLFINENKKTMEIYFGVLAIGMLFATVASKATAAIYIVIAQSILIIIYYKKSIFSNKMKNILFIISIIGCFSVINGISNNKLITIMEEGFKNTPSITNEKEKFIMSDINMSKDVLEIKGEENSLLIEVDSGNNNKLSFRDDKFNEIEPVLKDNNITFSESDFKAISIHQLPYGIVIDIGYNDTMEFYFAEDGFKGVGQNGTKIDKIKRDKVILPNLYSIATGRGYAWVNTIPLLKDNILWGYGPGTFAMYFQQNDYLGLMNTHGSAKFVIDKPHNMYLQVITQTGALSLVALIIVFIISIKRSINCYFTNIVEKSNEVAIGFGIFVGVLGFLISSLVNDSIVTVNPIFWVLLGCNLSIIIYLNRKYNIEV